MQRVESVSRGNAARSTDSTRRPARASSRAVAAPAQRAPTTMASYNVLSLPRSVGAGAPRAPTPTCSDASSLAAGEQLVGQRQGSLVQSPVAEGLGADAQRRRIRVLHDAVKQSAVQVPFRAHRLPGIDELRGHGSDCRGLGEASLNADGSSGRRRARRWRHEGTELPSGVSCGERCRAGYRAWSPGVTRRAS